ncbi:MAG: hypothetical protein SVY15_02845 [Halobacteriota archaeon]|nr:hypothetical protein [Halobacteriota archaeon]MDY6959255.1 hypothetical protein [Halobacteriota archaeon]
MCGWDIPEEENDRMKDFIGRRVKDAYCVKPYRGFTQYIIEFDDGNKIVWRFEDDACDVEFSKEG